MGRARGSDAFLDVVYESTYGTIPTSGYTRLPFISSNLGAEQGLLADDTLGYGREPLDPTEDVINNDGDLVVPVDERAFGFWLKLFFGDPDTAGGVHTFTSGATAADLPSMTAQIGLPAVPNYEKNFGLKGNSLRIAMSRRGLLNATLGLVGKGSTDAATSSSGTPDTIVMSRFAQATGQVTKDASALASVVSAEFTYSNNLDKVETIQPDGMIEDVDPGDSTVTGSVTLKFASTAMLTAALSGDPMALTFGWTKGSAGLLFTLPRVFLPKLAKKPVNGPGGIQATFNFQASGADETTPHVLVAELTNDVSSY